MLNILSYSLQMTTRFTQITDNIIFTIMKYCIKEFNCFFNNRFNSQTIRSITVSSGYITLRVSTNKHLYYLFIGTRRASAFMYHFVVEYRKMSYLYQIYLPIFVKPVSILNFSQSCTIYSPR